MADHRRSPALRVRRGRELPSLLPPGMARGADVAPAYGLRDDSSSREHRRIPALLGARDVARRMGRRCRLGGGLLPLASARVATRVAVSEHQLALSPTRDS